MLSVWLSIAEAADCPERLSPEQWSADLRALEEQAAMAEAAVPDGLDRLEYLAGGCVDGPLSQRDISGLWLARGAFAVLSGAIAPSTPDQFAAAWSIGGENAWNPVYGPDVQAWFIRSGGDGASGSLTVYLPSDILVVDGEVRYEEGPFSLPAGLHLVQWSLDGSWGGTWVKVPAGRGAVLGEPPAPDGEAKPPPVSAWTLVPGASVWRVSGAFEPGAQAAAQLAQTELGPLAVAEGGARSEGSFSSASLGLALRWSRARVWSELGLSGALPASEGAFPWMQSASLSGGWRREGAVELAVGPGLRLVGLPQVESVSADGVPTFGLDPAVFGLIHADLRAGGDLAARVSVEGWAGPAGLGVWGSVGPSARFGSVEPHLVLNLGAARGAGSFRGVGATGGVRWSF